MVTHYGTIMEAYYCRPPTEMTISRLGTIKQRKGDNMTSLDVVKMVSLNPSVALQLISEK